MTNNSDKLRSLILAALMVFSVFAGSIALTGSAAAQAGNLNSGSSYFAGQDVTADNLDDTQDYRVRAVEDGEPGTLIRTLDASGSTIEFTLDGELSSGDFVIVDESGDVVVFDDGSLQSTEEPTESNTSDAEFEVVSQDLTAEFEDSSVGNSGGSATVDYEIESDKRNDYNVNISADGLDDEDLQEIFGDAVEDDVSEDDDVIEVAGDTEFNLDFDGQDADTYTFEANVTDSDASDADDIEVTDTGDASADFDDNVYVDQRGDIVNITVEMENTDEATIQLGQESNNGYALVAEVTDDDEDGVAYVEFNSFTAGNPNETELVAGDDDTDVTVTSATDLGNEPSGTDILDSTNYDLFVTEGFQNSVNSNNADARATLQLNDASVDDLQVWTALKTPTTTSTARMPRTSTTTSTTTSRRPTPSQQATRSSCRSRPPVSRALSRTATLATRRLCCTVRPPRLTQATDWSA
ncbi:surface glycoprotein [Halomicroarcula sp. GCM10025894]|uniref:DUF7827 domain-containing protein n=1 Tax=Halomicroarcula sp. GCM10025894 TaxID=3252673 RepID=UPI00360F5211